MSRIPMFLHHGEEIWGTCYKCKSACKLFYDDAPKSFDRANRIGLCITASVPAQSMPRIVDPKEFDEKKDIISCFNCVGNVFFTKNDELFRKCPVCLRFFDDSDIDMTHYAHGPWTGTSYDIHKYECQERDRKWQSWENQRYDPIQESMYRQPITKPKQAFLIRREPK